MLSISNLTSSTNASKYYMGATDYYGVAKEGVKPEFQGRLADVLIDQNANFRARSFERLLEGRISPSIRLGRMREGKFDHRPGVDLTFSAPKSVSILALVNKDEKLVELFKEAVTNTLKYAEDNLLLTRVNGKTEKASNMLAVKFLETTSRENDPQLHMHCPIMNMVLCEDGKYRSMCTEKLYESKMFLGQFFRNDLARLLIENNYQLDVNRRDGTFEISGVPKPLITLFSKRSGQIKTLAEKFNVTSAIAKAKLAITSRSQKAAMSFDSLRNKWIDEARSHGYEMDKLNVPMGTRETAENIKKITRHAINHSLNKLDSLSNGYSKESVLHEMMKGYIGSRVSPAESERRFDRYLKLGKIQQIDESTYISSKAMSSKEVADNAVVSMGSQLRLTENFSTRRDADTFKHQLDKHKKQGIDYTIVGLTSLARENLWDEGIKSISFGKFMPRNLSKNEKIYIFGLERATYGTYQKVMEKLRDLGAEAIVVSDGRKSRGLETPVDSIKAHGVNTRILAQNDNHIKAVMDLKSHNIESLKDIAKLHDGQSLIISNQAKRLNKEVKSTLLEKGLLSSENITLNNFVSVQLTDSELQNPTFYQAGDVLKVKNLSHLNEVDKKVSEGQHWEVVSVEKSVLNIKHERTGLATTIDLDEKNISKDSLALYRKSALTLHVGERVILPADNIYGERFMNNIGVVKSIDSGKVIIELHDGKKFDLYTVNRKTYIESAYAVTPNRPIGQYDGAISLHLKAQSHKAFIDRLSNRKLALVTNTYRQGDFESTKQEDVSSRKLPSLNESQSLGSNRNPSIKQALEKMDPESIKVRESHHAIKSSVSLLSEKDYYFTKEDVLREAFIFVLSGVDVTDLEVQFDAAVKRGDIIKEGEKNTSAIFTSKKLFEERTRLLDSLNNLKIESPMSLTTPILADIPKEHQAAIKGLIESENQVSIVQGYAGVAKTSLTLKTYSDYMKQSGYDVRGFAPTHSACGELKSKAGIESKTIARLMIDINNQKTQFNEKSVVIVDEASMLSIPDMTKLIGAVSESGARLVLVGDKNQQPSVGAGEMFREMVDAKSVNVFEIKSILRQQDQNYREATQSLAQGQVDAFFNKMDKNIVAVERKALSEAVARQYVSLIEAERAQTRIITLTNDSRNQINKMVREGLCVQGALDSNKTYIGMLESKPFHQAKKHFASNVEVGDVIRFASKDERYAFNAGEYVKVLSLSDKLNELLVQRESGETVNFRIDRSSIMKHNGLELYQEKMNEVSVGDKLIFRRAMNDIQVKNTDIGEVISVNGNMLHVKSNGEMKAIDMTKKDHCHMDYGYAITSHLFQGKDCKHVLIHMDTKSGKLVNYNSLYVGATRGKETMTLYTDDKAILKEKVTESYLEKNPSKELQAPALGYKEPHFTQNIPILTENERLAIQKSAEQIALTILGQPIKRTKGALHFGEKKGSLQVTISGANQGLWYDFASGEGGDMVKLVQTYQGYDFKDAAQFAKRVAGVSEVHQEKIAVKVVKPSEILAPDTDIDRKLKARSIFERGVSIEHTIAEKYLTQHRKIPIETVRLAQSEIRYLKDFYFDSKPEKTYHAIVFAAKDEKGNISGVQAILLDNKTADKAKMDTVKFSMGAIKGSALELGKPGGNVYLAEGPETALSILAAKPDANIKATFSISGLSNVVIPLSNQPVVICADNDAGKEVTQKALAKAIDSLSSRGHDVSISMPKSPGEDYNDVLKRAGVEGVRRELSHSQPQLTPQIEQKVVSL